MTQPLHAADKLAFDRAISVKPVWNQMDTAGAFLGLDENVLLHAGPPFTGLAEIPKPIMNSACVAAVFEGLAPDFDQAGKMIGAGEIILRPAQDHAVVTPLAAVVSASMPLHRVSDKNNRDTTACAPINGGFRPSMRLGMRSAAVVDHINWLNGEFCAVLQSAIDTRGIELIPLAVLGLREGDDCHGRTVAAAKALIRELADRTPHGINNKDVIEFMSSSPGLFLNLWMAATKCIMSAATGIVDSSFVTAVGGNGVFTGIQVSGLPGRWFTTNANPPVGRFDVDVPGNRALGAIGDSAVVEGFGLGAMAINLSPEQEKNLGEFLPDDADNRFSGLPMGSHTGFHPLPVRLGLNARAVAALGVGPLVGLGILDREGAEGRLGGGIYDMPVAPFVEALAALEARHP